MGIIFIGLFFMIIGMIVSSKLKSKFKKYSEVHLAKDLSGEQVAKLMLADHGINDVKVTCVEGQLTDHYNPATKTVNLSEAVFTGRNASATAVASHECGHAVQHATAYSMLSLRSALVPVQNISSTILNVIFMAMIFGGALLQNIIPWSTAILVIVLCYAVFALFALITLPVEFDASNRALAWVKSRSIVTPQEYDMAKDALKWAAMTYVVVAIGAVVTLMYYLMILFAGRRD